MALAVPDSTTGVLATLAHAKELVASCTDVDEAKSIRDRAEALRIYARQANYGLEIQNECAEVKLRAERRAGELLTSDPELGRGKSDRLSHLGIERHQSSRWQQVAAVPVEVFEEHIASVKEANRELTTASVRKLAKQLAASAPVSVVPDAPPGVYRTIVADPPWQYGNTATRGSAEDHYPTMDLDAICKLSVEVDEWADTNAHLYLWTTNNFLRQAFDVIDAWGFDYKTCLTWVKPQIGMGNYFRSRTEHVLFCTRGSLGTSQRDVSNVIDADRTQHSAKPDAFYDMVQVQSPGPYLEMFARRRRFGWDVWGNEA